MEGFENTEQDISKLLGFGGFGSTKVRAYCFVFCVLYSVFCILCFVFCVLYSVFFMRWFYSFVYLYICTFLAQLFMLYLLHQWDATVLLRWIVFNSLDYIILYNEFIACCFLFSRIYLTLPFPIYCFELMHRFTVCL